jgi:competence protein ComEC
VNRSKRGCGCAIAVVVVVLIAGGYFGKKYVLPWWKTRPPQPSGAELQVHILDVGPVNGDAILIISPTGKSILIDSGDTGKGKVVLDALKRYNVQQLDYFIGTHPHPDHLGGADEVISATKVLNVIDNGLPPAVPASLMPATKTAAPNKKPVSNKPVNIKPSAGSSITKFYDEYKAAVEQSGAHYEKAVPGKQYDLGGGARMTIVAPSEPYFTKEQMKTGGNETNANSVVVRLEYGEFSMLFTGDAEEQTEHRLLTKELNLEAKILKVAHHGSKYATTQDFLNRVKPEAAIISCGEWNRYGHPAQTVLDRLRSMNARVYRTDLQGEVTITTTGRLKSDKLYEIKTAKEAKSDIWAGRMAQKDDSSRAGFIAYGDFGPPPKAARKP